MGANMRRGLWKKLAIAMGGLILLCYAPILLIDLSAWYQVKTFAVPNLDYPGAIVLERGDGKGVHIASDVRVEQTLSMATGDEPEIVLQYYTEFLNKQGWTIEQQSSDTLQISYRVKRFEQGIQGPERYFVDSPIYGLEIQLSEESETTIIKIAYFHLMYM
jgi:hypothetical protein